jgi:hypothetical protein
LKVKLYDLPDSSFINTAKLICIGNLDTYKPNYQIVFSFNKQDSIYYCTVPKRYRKFLKIAVQVEGENYYFIMGVLNSNELQKKYINVKKYNLD